MGKAVATIPFAHTWRHAARKTDRLVDVGERPLQRPENAIRPEAGREMVLDLAQLG